MEGFRRSPEAPRVSGLPDAGQAPGEAGALLRQLIPLPGSQSVGPLSLLPAPAKGGALPPVAGNEDAASSIVAQAASILDEEMARGLLSARSGAGTAAPGPAGAGYPVLLQMHEFVDNLAALWPNLQAGAAKSPAAHRQPAEDASQPLATVRPRAAVRPGERAIVSMTLRNSESRPVRLVPTATDLIGSHGGRIPNSLLEFEPPELTLAPQEQKDLSISATIPGEAPAGCYSGLLVVKGLDYLRALITIEVAGKTVAPESMQSSLPPRIAEFPGGATGREPARNSGVLQEATRLAEDGELGNSDAIRLLQMPHRPEDLKEVLARFEQQLTREAKSKLTLQAFAPLPAGVDNQRYEPLFDRYPITGKTYTTASGTVVLNEIQYYNGEMVQLHGECSNVAPVREALAGSGYKPLMVRQADGRASAIAQFWSHQLTDTSLRPYNAAFIIVAAVPEETPEERARFAAGGNGASSMLAMVDGTVDPDKGHYENRARLFYVRLLDSTQVAIEVGRERMGTDKRPGTIDLVREGRRRSFSVKDGAGSPVATIDFVIADDPRACHAEVAAAAAAAGIRLQALPPGTECIYPCVARIGTGPVLTWQWRSDVLPRLQHLEPGTATFDERSEAGELLIRWGFKPKVLGYIPNVRGVVTGVP